MQKSSEDTSLEGIKENDRAVTVTAGQQGLLSALLLRDEAPC
jgi:hypothetical protein